MAIFPRGTPEREIARNGDLAPSDDGDTSLVPLVFSLPHEMGTRSDEGRATEKYTATSRWGNGHSMAQPGVKRIRY